VPSSAAARAGGAPSGRAAGLCLLRVAIPQERARGHLGRIIRGEPQHPQHQGRVVVGRVAACASLKYRAHHAEERAGGCDQRDVPVVDLEAARLDPAVDVAGGVGTEGGESEVVARRYYAENREKMIARVSARAAELRKERGGVRHTRRRAAYFWTDRLR
jgi:hypothetical protein